MSDLASRLRNLFQITTDGHKPYIEAIDGVFGGDVDNYNFCRIHKTLRVTPAMAAGVVDRVMDMNDLAVLIAARESPVAKRGPYKKKAA